MRRKNDSRILRALSSGRYWASEEGEVFNLETGKELSQSLLNGYPAINLRDGTHFLALVHVVVWIQYRGLPDPCKVIDHEDENKLNPSLGNLKLITQSQNVTKSYRARGIVPEPPKIKARNTAYEEALKDLLDRGLYDVTEDGSVISLRTGKKLKPCLINGKYLAVVLYEGRKRYSAYLHVLKRLKFGENQDGKDLPSL